MVGFWPSAFAGFQDSNFEVSFGAAHSNAPKKEACISIQTSMTVLIEVFFNVNLSHSHGSDAGATYYRQFPKAAYILGLMTTPVTPFPHHKKHWDPPSPLESSKMLFEGSGRFAGVE